MRAPSLRRLITLASPESEERFTFGEPAGDSNSSPCSCTTLVMLVTCGSRKRRDGTERCELLSAVLCSLQNRTGAK